MWISDQVLTSTAFATEILDIIQKEINPNYTNNTWCGSCVKDMLVLAFQHMDSLPKTVQNDLHTPNGGNKPKHHHRR